MRISGGQTPYYKRLMVFVDGSNFLIELSKDLDIKFRADKPPLASFALAKGLIEMISNKSGFIKIRRYWFGSYTGNEQYGFQLCEALRNNDFEPVLFKKHGGKEKGVDIALTKEMLVNAFNQNFDVGLLVAGDEDYVGLVNEVKRYGPVIEGAFFENGLSKTLRLSFDSFTNMSGQRSAGDPLQALVEEILKEVSSHSS